MMKFGRAALLAIGRWIDRQPRSAWATAVGAWAVYTLYNWAQWRRAQYPSVDLAIFTQLMQRYTHFQAPIVTVKGPDYNLLGDHFHPLLVVLAPFYALAPSAFTMLVLQNILIAISVFVVAKTAHELIGPSAGWLVGVAYALSYGIGGAVHVQFHEVALAAPMLAIGLRLFLRERYEAAAVWISLLAFVKEELGLTIAFFGLVLWIRTRRPVLSAIVAVWGLASWAIETFVLLPALNANGGYDHAGKLNAAALLNDPLGIPQEIYSNDYKMATLMMVVLAGAGFAFRSPLALLVIPTLGWRMLSGLVYHWLNNWHYDLVMMPTLYLAAVEGIALMAASRHEWGRRWARHGAAIMAAVALTWLPGQTAWAVTRPSTWQLNDRSHAALALVAAIPPGSVIEADDSLVQRLVDRGQVYAWGKRGNPVPTHLVIDRQFNGSQNIDPVAEGAKLHPGTRWELVSNQQNYQLARRVE